MMQVVERREWMEDGKVRCELIFADPRTDARYTLVASPAAFAAHPLGLEVGLAARTPDGEC